ncbi:MAG: hypothetical protein K0Q79_532 [Flavipsychrobacter sp.]|jgi:hypothetical protein|nr:hypothetical protein [Flavipsychrobacter sp.]
MKHIFYALVFFSCPALLHAQSTITLRRSFVDSFKNRLTIDADYDVWFSHKKPNKPENDGDIHVSGYDRKIGMPSVAEMMNAVEEQDAMKMLIRHEGKGKINNPKISVTGVWRLWPEHMGGNGNTFAQGMKLTKEEITKGTTNPDHVFEIHPLTRVGDFDVKRTFHEISGYSPYYAWYVLEKVGNHTCEISSTSKKISIATKQIGYNYIDAWIRIDDITDVKDGAFATCTILDHDFARGRSVSVHKIADNVRVGFVKGTQPWEEAVQEGRGWFLHILGTSRINLAAVADAAANGTADLPLPMEIIAVGLID